MEMKYLILTGFFLPCLYLELSRATQGIASSSRLLGITVIPLELWFSCLKLSFAVSLSIYLYLNSWSYSTQLSTAFWRCYMPTYWWKPGCPRHGHCCLVQLERNEVNFLWEGPDNVLKQWDRKEKQPVIYVITQALGQAKEGGAEPWISDLDTKWPNSEELRTLSFYIKHFLKKNFFDVLIKLYLQNQAANWIWSSGYSLPTPNLFSLWFDHQQLFKFLFFN